MAVSWLQEGDLDRARGAWANHQPEASGAGAARARSVWEWGYKGGIRACYIEIGAPRENGYVESFHV